jgi:predicted ATP-dependent Lon-type protease
MQYILNNQTADPREAFVNFHDTELKALISEVYNTPEKFAALNERLIRYTRTFEHIDVVREIWQEKETAQIAKGKNVDIQKAIEDGQQTLISQILKNEEENEEEEDN